MVCHCINHQVLTRARNGVTATLSLKPGQSLLFNFVTTAPHPISLWVTSPWATDKAVANPVIPGPFRLNLPGNPGSVKINFSADKKLRLEDGPNTKVLMQAPDSAASVDFEFQGWVADIKVRNVTVWDPAGTGTIMPTRTCFEDQTNATGVDKITACTACTSDNIIAGCLGLDFKSGTVLEYILGAAAFVIVAMLIKRFI